MINLLVSSTSFGNTAHSMNNRLAAADLQCQRGGDTVIGSTRSAQVLSTSDLVSFRAHGALWNVRLAHRKLLLPFQHPYPSVTSPHHIEVTSLILWARYDIRLSLQQGTGRSRSPRPKNGPSELQPQSQQARKCVVKRRGFVFLPKAKHTPG
jgi:hypothetical protein